MRAVWSFWSKPYKANAGRTWRAPRHHLLAWGLSLRLAQRRFDETMLVTDSEGKALLVDALGLEFDAVRTDLDGLRKADRGWWALGKLIAYSVQDRPFLHMDTDVFLWNAPPAALLAAPVFAQCPERYSRKHDGWGPRIVEELFARHGLTLPAEWEWVSSKGEEWFREENCGILGGNRWDFLNYYAKTAIGIALDPAHAAVWAEVTHKDGFNMLLEQHFLSACVEYHRNHPTSAFKGVRMRHLFPSLEDAFDHEAAARAGFTHLLGDAKAHPEVAERLERRMAELDPAFHRHCVRVAERDSRVEAGLGG